MPIDARGDYDVVLGRIIAALVAYSTAQAAIDSGVAFRAIPGSFRTMQPAKVPTVGVHLASMNSANATGRSQEWELSATYNLDLVANGKAAGNTRGDSAAHARLMYLVQQVLNALYESDRRTVIEAGGITLAWPTWTLAEPESYQEESPLIGGRLSIDARMTYVPAPSVGTPIDSVHVDTTLWEALYEYDGGYY